MKTTPRWQESVLETARRKQADLPWAKASRRKACRLRVDTAGCSEQDPAP